jgi:hypothetical protein
MRRWARESSPVDVQCAHTKRVTVTPSRPVPDPAGPAAAETVTGTGTDVMITDATAARRESQRYMMGCTCHMPSHPLQKRFSPLVFALVLSIMPQRREAPASKKGRGGQLAIATKMAGKPKLVVKHLKLKELMLKVKVRGCRQLLIVLKIQNLRRVRMKLLQRTAPCLNQKFVN